MEVGWVGDACGHGCRATRNVAAGEVVLRVPTALMLSLHVGPASARSPVPRLVAADPLLRATPTLGLALLLAHERLQGAHSAFAPYLAVLPASFDVPLAWRPRDLQPLRAASPAVYNRAVNGWRMALKQYVYLAHKAAREPGGFGQHFPVVAASGDGARPLFTLALFRWALATAITRQNEVPAALGATTLALIPLWDMCNHHPSKETDTRFVAAESTSAGGALECRALKPIAEGAPVHIFYGERPSSELLLYSGFVPAPQEALAPEAPGAPLANAHDCLPAPLTWGLEVRLV